MFLSFCKFSLASNFHIIKLLFNIASFKSSSILTGRVHLFVPGFNNCFIYLQFLISIVFVLAILYSLIPLCCLIIVFFSSYLHSHLIYFLLFFVFVHSTFSGLFLLCVIVVFPHLLLFTLSECLLRILFVSVLIALLFFLT